MFGQRLNSPRGVQPRCWAPNVVIFLQLSSASRDLCRSREAPPPSSPPPKARQSRHRCPGCSGSGYTRFTLYHHPTRCFNAATGNTNAVPKTAPPPVKKPRKRRNEVELLRDCGESNEILLSPPPSRGSPLSPPLPASSRQPSQPTPPSDHPAPETTELLRLEPASPLLEPTEPPEMPTTPPSTAPPPPSHLGTPAPATAVTSLNERAATTIPDAPPMSTFFPSCPFKVICRYCLCDDHDVRYRQCPSCYKKRGGTNYSGW
jgi:hypothetical protein